MLPDYWIEQPPFTLDDATRAAAEEVLSRAGGDDVLDIGELLGDREVERWHLLCGLASGRELAFHGTGDPSIASFEPRRPIDFAPFGDQRAVFATGDPIWAMYYAIVDRDRYALTLNNGCIWLEGGPPHYYFSISRSALPKRPWRTGYVYVLPAETFVEQPAGTYAGHAARVPQLASPVAVRPYARLEVHPDDFPFLDHIRGHDDDRLAEYAEAVMAAAPWPE